MSFFNYLSARQYSLDSTNYGAPSNATVNTDYLGDIVLNPSPSATVIVQSLALNAVDEGATTNPTITTDSSGNIYLNPDTASSVQITSNLTVTGTTLTLGNSSGGTISNAGSLNINSGSGGTITLNSDFVNLAGTTSTYVNTGSVHMLFPGTTSTGYNSFYFGPSTSGSTTGLAKMNMFNNQNTAVGTFLIDSENNLNIYNETATTPPSLQLASSGEVNVSGVLNAFSTIQSGNATFTNSGTVTFSYTFSSAPIVVCTPCLVGGSPWYGIVSVTASTTTTFDVELVNYNGVAVNYPASFNWIAMVAS
jgi:hypothetical protein